MPLYFRNKVLLAKVEDTYGTDAAPDAAANAMQVANLSIRPMEGGTASRDIDRPYFGARPELLVDTHVVMEFEVEIAGSGTAGSAPAAGPLFRAAGFAETVAAGVEARYTPVSSGFESVTLSLNLDGTLHKMLGGRGSFRIRPPRSGVPVFAFTFSGLFIQPTAEARPTPDWSAWQKPLPVADANSDFTLNGVALPMESIEVDIGNQVEARFLVNSESVEITDRAVTGTTTVEQQPLGIFDAYALAKARTTMPLAFQHGQAAGAIVAVDAPAVELGRPSIGESQGIATWSLPLRCLPQAGDDDLTLTFR